MDYVEWSSYKEVTLKNAEFLYKKKKTYDKSQKCESFYTTFGTQCHIKMRKSTADG